MHDTVQPARNQEDARGYNVLPRSIQRRTDLTPSDKLVLQSLHQWCWGIRSCTVCNATIAAASGISSATVKRSLSALRKLGLIAVSRNPKVLSGRSIEFAGEAIPSVKSAQKSSNPGAKLSPGVAQIDPGSAQIGPPYNSRRRNEKTPLPNGAKVIEVLTIASSREMHLQAELTRASVRDGILRERENGESEQAILDHVVRSMTANQERFEFTDREQRRYAALITAELRANLSIPIPSLVRRPLASKSL